MQILLADFSWSNGLSQGISDFGTLFQAAMGNPLIMGVTMVSVAAGLIGLLWSIFR